MFRDKGDSRRDDGVRGWDGRGGGDGVSEQYFAKFDEMKFFIELDMMGDEDDDMPLEETTGV